MTDLPRIKPLTRRQQLLLTGLSLQAIISVANEYPRRHTINFDQLVDQRFAEAVRRAQHQEQETGIVGGLLELPAEQLVLTTEVDEVLGLLEEEGQ